MKVWQIINNKIPQWTQEEPRQLVRRCFQMLGFQQRLQPVKITIWYHLFVCLFFFSLPLFFHEFVFELRKRCCPFRNETRPQNWTLQVVIRSTEQKAFFGLVTHSHVLSDILIKVHLKLLIFLIKRHLIISTTCKLPRVENVFLTCTVVV